MLFEDFVVSGKSSRWCLYTEKREREQVKAFRGITF